MPLLLLRAAAEALTQPVPRTASPNRKLFQASVYCGHAAKIKQEAEIMGRHYALAATREGRWSLVGALDHFINNHKTPHTTTPASGARPRVVHRWVLEHGWMGLVQG